MAVNAAVFLDKDGTLVENVPYNADPAKIRLVAGAGEALRAMQEAGYRIFVVSNQSGVARGYFPETALGGVLKRLREMLAGQGVELAGFYYCPHHPQGHCACRKPQPGLILRAAAEHEVDLGKSWLVGDILDDVEAGRRAGCRTILVDNGNETEWRNGAERTPHFKVADLAGAARVIAEGAR